jgi:hypothetical protein
MVGIAGNKKQARNRQDLADSLAPQVAELWLQGRSQLNIAKQLKIGVAKVTQMLTEARGGWLERKNLALAEVIAEQLRRVDLIETKAWEDYEKSRGEHRKTRIKSSAGGIEKTHESEERSGDPRFLEMALKCVEQRCKLLGVYKPPEERAEINVWGVTVVVDTPEQAESILEYEQFKSMVVDGESSPVAEEGLPNGIPQ